MRTASTALLLAAIVSACQTQGELQCGDPHTPIHQIQGSQSVSELQGENHITEGVVTGHYLDREGQITGAFVQSDQPDNNPDTSDALFAINVTDPIGTRVRISGTVVELDRRLTSIDTDQIQACGSAPLPPPGPAFLPLQGRHIESLEAVRISITSDMGFADVSRMGSDGEAVVAAGSRLYSPTEIAQPGEIAEQVRVANLRRSLILDDFSEQRYGSKISWWPDAAKGLPRAGLGVDGLTGIMDHRGGYRLHLSEPARMAQPPERQLPEPPAVRGNLRIVGFNLLNLFNGNGKGGDFPTSRGARSKQEYQRQLAKLVAAITALNPDVLALAELENDGQGPTSAVADLQRALTESSGRPYEIIGGPSAGLGDDEIAVGLIYASDTVVPESSPRSLTRGAFDRLNRPPLAQRLRHRSSGQGFSVVALHLKSKGCGEAKGANADRGDGQGCWNASRLEAARALVEWIEADPEMDADSTVLIGDFNAYSREDPVLHLAKQGYRSLLARRQPQYSYVYRGAAGSLDQAMAGRTLSAKLAGAGYWHINADYPSWLDYRLGNQPDTLYRADPLRSSDHDPVVVDFQL